MFYAEMCSHTLFVGWYSMNSLTFGFDKDNMASVIHEDHSYIEYCVKQISDLAQQRAYQLQVWCLRSQEYVMNLFRAC